MNRKTYLIVGFAFIVACGFLIKNDPLTPKKTYAVETGDITNFWIAYDSLKTAHTATDSAGLIKRLYLDKMSKYGKKYIEIRNYTAPEYVRVLRKYPRYFTELRKKTDRLMTHKPEIDSAFNKFNAVIPKYRYPDVCFAIGCFRGGGTRTKNKEALLIGCEIALADSNMNHSEFKGTLRSIFSHADGNIAALIAHESVHCQQFNGKNYSLLSMAMSEGTADFLTMLILKGNINIANNTYGMEYECGLWKEFEPQINSDDVSKWLYNTSPNESRPADLGYFMGRRICEAYYNKQNDKTQAIANLLNRGNYLVIMKESGYNGHCKN